MLALRGRIVKTRNQQFICERLPHVFVWIPLQHWGLWRKRKPSFLRESIEEPLPTMNKNRDSTMVWTGMHFALTAWMLSMSSWIKGHSRHFDKLNFFSNSSNRFCKKISKKWILPRKLLRCNHMCQILPVVWVRATEQSLARQRLKWSVFVDF